MYSRSHLDVAEGRVVAEHLHVDHAHEELLHLLASHGCFGHLSLQNAHLKQEVTSPRRE